MKGIKEYNVSHPYRFDTSLVEACEELCDKWVKWDVKEPCQFVKKDLDAFSSEQVIIQFLFVCSEPFS